MNLTRKPIHVYDVIASSAGWSSGGWPGGGAKQSQEFASSPPKADPRPPASPGCRYATQRFGRARNDERRFRTGANMLFLGIVRDHSQGKKVLYLEYEAYEEMAERLIAEMVFEACQRWSLEGITLLHRLGRVDLGEIAVAIDVRSAHREEAYQASRYLIEGVKHRIPIWKKEYFTDGASQWGLCTPPQVAYVEI